jgi:hypothetical protein
LQNEITLFVLDIPTHSKYKPIDIFAMSTETIFFQEGEVLVTNARFVVGPQTFAMRTITSVKGEMTPANYTGAVLLILIGLTISLVAFFNLAIAMGILGVFIFAAGIWIACRRKSIYAVVLTTAGGEITAHASKDWSYISQIIEALNQSIISHD